MSRILILIFFIVGGVVLLNLKDHQEMKVVNKRFNYQEEKALFEKKQKEIAKLTAKKEPKKEKKVVEKPKGPVVELTTDQLKRGAALYAKCIVCHGKRREGKKSQNAPRVGGQHEWYLYEQLVNMKSKVRVNKKMDPYIRKLEEEDFKDLAHYMSKMPWK